MNAPKILQSHRSFLEGEDVVQATEDALAAAVALNQRNAVFSVLDPVGALRAATESQRRYARGAPLGPLDGAVVSVKDVLLTNGLATLRGSRAVPRQQPWDIDAPVVSRLRAAGAVLIGKTTTSELGWKAVTDSEICGVTSNPHDASLTSGGSSGGSAVAVQQGIGSLSLGTDGGGSVRIPAAFCGVVGYKPTYGRLPLHPLGPLGRLVHIGSLTRSVGDARLTYRTLAGPSVWDATSLPAECADSDETGLGGRRCAYVGFSGCGLPLDPSVKEAVERVIGALLSAGVDVEERRLLGPDLEETYWTLWAVGHAAMATRWNYALTALGDAGLVDLIKHGGRQDGVRFSLSQVRAVEFASEVAQLMDDVDFLLTPTVPILPFGTGGDVPHGSGLDRWSQWTPFTYPFNLTEQPAISIPVGGGDCLLPVGIQMIARRYDDLRLLDWAEELEGLLA